VLINAVLRAMHMWRRRYATALDDSFNPLKQLCLLVELAIKHGLKGGLISGRKGGWRVVESVEKAHKESEPVVPFNCLSCFLFWWSCAIASAGESRKITL
jgi:hypothetical protein